MHVLALDTTTRDGSVALVSLDGIVDERRGDGARTHAERLPAELLDVAAAHGLNADDIDVFAVASGPGSFTGLRIGIATVQGLAFATSRRVVAVSALDALAASAGNRQNPDSSVAARMDARRHEVFAALYRTGARALELTTVDDPMVGDPAAVLARWAGLVGSESVVFIGDGATLYADEIRRTRLAGSIVAHPLLAGTIGRIAVKAAERGETIDPAAIRPLYVRRPDAELARDRHAAVRDERAGH
jgi:tRNA threonylcarbamoyladenosine biosynthesis protein TsaB